VPTVAEAKAILQQLRPAQRRQVLQWATEQFGRAAIEPPSVSERELQVLRKLAGGYNYEAIAQSLGVSIKTVEAHRRSLGWKFGATDREALLSAARETGFLKR
jgi:DNA-binding NarL/FixJ family response regulator